MNAATEAQITALVVGVLATLLWRLIDRYLPEPSGTHPKHGRSGIDAAVHPDTPSTYDAEVHINHSVIWSGRVEVREDDRGLPDLLRQLVDLVGHPTRR